MLQVLGNNPSVSSHDMIQVSADITVCGSLLLLSYAGLMLRTSLPSLSIDFADSTSMQAQVLRYAYSIWFPEIKELLQNYMPSADNRSLQHKGMRQARIFIRALGQMYVPTQEKSIHIPHLPRSGQGQPGATW